MNLLKIIKHLIDDYVNFHDDVIKWKDLRYCAFVWGIHRSPVNSSHRGQWRGAWMFSLICAWINGWVNNRDAGDLRRHRPHNYVTVMWIYFCVASDNNFFKISTYPFQWHKIAMSDWVNDYFAKWPHFFQVTSSVNLKNYAHYLHVVVVVDLPIF